MPRKKISVGVTAFLDILGFGNRVLTATSIKDVDDITADVKRIQREFDYKSTSNSVRKVQAAYKKTVLAFSDSVIVNIPLQSEMTELQGTFDAMMSELDELGTAQARCVNQGLFLRGGVDLGWWYRRGSTLVSQSMVRAYRTEGMADVPVIALTEDLYDFFAKHQARNHYSPDIEPIHRLLRPYQDACGNVKFWHLDYIKMFAEDIGWVTSKAQHTKYLNATEDEKDEIMAAGYTKNRDAWFDHHARTIEKAHALAASSTVKAKYTWLATYHNEVAAHLTKNPSSICTAK